MGGESYSLSPHKKCVEEATAPATQASAQAIGASSVAKVPPTTTGGRMTIAEWDDDAEEFGRWREMSVDGELVNVWVPHCPYHPGFAKPCQICEAMPLSPAEGAEA
jgi:hypothetical protein